MKATPGPRCLDRAVGGRSRVGRRSRRASRRSRSVRLRCSTTSRRPGARSLAMGASFIGLADDATASESNPAGLTILTKPEVSAHFRYLVLRQRGPQHRLGTGFDTFNDKVGSPSFFSLVYPLKGAAVSVYYQRSADFRSHSFFDGVTSGHQGNLRQLRPGGDAVQGREPRRARRPSSSGEDALDRRLGPHARASASTPCSRPRSRSPTRTVRTACSSGGTSTPTSPSRKVTWNAGVLFTPVSQFTIGAVYKKGAKYDFSTDFVDGRDRRRRHRSTSAARSSRSPSGSPTSTAAAWRSGPRRASPSSPTSCRSSTPRPIPGPASRTSISRPGREDARPWRTAPSSTSAPSTPGRAATTGCSPSALGYYSDPDHDGLAGLDSKQDHFTVGGGVVVKNQLQVDVAGNFAKNVKEGLLSFVVRF